MIKKRLWHLKTFKVSDNPREGDPVQYVVIHVLDLEKIKKSGLEIEPYFYMRDDDC